MKTSCRLLRRVFASLIVLVVCTTLSGLTRDARAGCLREWKQCGDCFKQKFNKAARGFDLSGIADAYVDAIDCDIDLFHCLVLGSHHTNPCAL
ncbi:MAG: hypothetical protein ACE5HV_00625 [Acidobacteriota bacterium]